MESGSRGLLKLMLRFPVIRGELQIGFGHNEALKELAEVYDDVTRTLETMQKNPQAEAKIKREYEELRAAIETDVLAVCSSLK